MLYALPQPTDRALSREVASAVAACLGSKVVSDRGIVLGEPQCHYAVRLNTERFWFGARFSPSHYVTRGTHKLIGKWALPFHASLKLPNESMLTQIPLQRASAVLGIQVFVSEISHGPIASDALCFSRVRDRLARLDFSSIQSVFISPFQLHLVGKIHSASHAAGQILAQRDLLECLCEHSISISRCRSSQRRAPAGPH